MRSEPQRISEAAGPEDLVGGAAFSLSVCDPEPTRVPDGWSDRGVKKRAFMARMQNQLDQLVPVIHAATVNKARKLSCTWRSCGGGAGAFITRLMNGCGETPAQSESFS